MTPRAVPEAGFTLLETLVALVVLGLLIGGLAQALRFGMLAWDRQARTIDSYGELDAVDRTLRRIIEQIDPGNSHDAPAFEGTASSVEFTSELPAGAAALPTRRAEMRLLVDGTHRLILRWAPYSHAVRIGAPPIPSDTVLVGQIDRLELAYWPGPSEAGTAGWRAEWRDAGLPALVRIRLIFAAGSGVRWPDIVAAPRLARP